MKKKQTVLTSLVLSGAVMVMAPQAWSQTGGSSGSGSSPSQKSSEGSGIGGSNRDTGSNRDASGSVGSSTDTQTQRDQSGRMGSSRRGAGHMAAGTHMSKDKVKEVQAALKNKGMDPGPEDGMMGPKTQAALREFQKSNNLQVTGRIDEKTASALGVEMAGASSMGSSSGASSGMGSSSSERSTGSAAGKGSGASGARSGGSSAYPDSTSLGKGSTAGKLESTDGNPK